MHSSGDKSKPLQTLHTKFQQALVELYGCAQDWTRHTNGNKYVLPLPRKAGQGFMMDSTGISVNYLFFLPTTQFRPST